MVQLLFGLLWIVISGVFSGVAVTRLTGDATVGTWFGFAVFFALLGLHQALSATINSKKS